MSLRESAAVRQQVAHLTAVPATDKPKRRSLRDVVRSLAPKPDVNPRELAARALGAMTRDERDAIVLNVITNEVANILRSETRQREQEVGDLREPPARQQARDLLAADYFALPDGTMVAWLTATAEQHRARADWQRTLAANVVADAERHEQAAEAIEAAGVSCLAEIEDAA